MSRDQFNQLSAWIKELTPDALKCIEATCFITRSTCVEQAVCETTGKKKDELPKDSEQFITFVVTECPDVLPICYMLSPESIQLLKYAYYPDTHARHMLDMEGGNNMLDNIVNGIRGKTLDYNQVNLWLARWIINIAGLNGHVSYKLNEKVEYKGSNYLLASLAECIFALRTELTQLLLDPQNQVINHYLAFRAEQLGFKNTRDNKCKYLASLAALMREYTPATGSEIMAWFDNLDENTQTAKLELFQQKLTATTVTPTFQPVIMETLRKMGCTVAETLTLFAEIQSKAMQVYSGTIADKTIPVCFRDVAYKKELEPIKKYYDKYNKIPELEIDSNGCVKAIITALELEALMSTGPAKSGT